MERLWELDVARTAAIGMMVAFHASYDVDMLAPQLGVEPRDGGLKALQVATGSLFLFLVGVSFAVSTARARARGLVGRALLRKQLRRAAEIFAAAMLITLVTLVLLGSDDYVRFGILHLIAVALALAPLAERLGPLNLIVAAGALVAGRWIGELHSDIPGLMAFGVRPEGDVGVDWYPLLPWIAPVLVGIVVGARLYPRGSRGGWASVLPAPPARAVALLGAPGRHALAVYLVHQGVLFPLVAATLLALGVAIET